MDRLPVYEVLSKLSRYAFCHNCLLPVCVTVISTIFFEVFDDGIIHKEKIIIMTLKQKSNQQSCEC